MKIPQGRAAPPKHNLPYFTEQDLEAPIKTVLVRVEGKYTKRSDQRKEVYEDDYEADIEVPAKWQMGHVKLGVNRYIKKELKGIRARTYEVNPDVDPVPQEKTRPRKYFMSQQGIMDNESKKRLYHEAQERRRRIDEDKRSGHYAPPPFEDTTDYGEDGLPPLRHDIG